jgi:hypothetical protein
MSPSTIKLLSPEPVIKKLALAAKIYVGSPGPESLKIVLFRVPS